MCVLLALPERFAFVLLDRKFCAYDRSGGIWLQREAGSSRASG